MKDDFLNVRIARSQKNKFEQLIEEKNTSKSNAIRSAIDYYIYINGKTKPAMIWSSSELNFLVEILDDSQILALAELSAKNRLDMHKYWYKSFYNVEDPMKEIAPKTIINDFFYNLQIKFLDQISIKSSWDKNKRFFVRIAHQFNTLNFSKYLKYFLQKYLNFFSLESISERVNAKAVILQFKLV